jgi:hypothetical protein
MYLKTREVILFFFRKMLDEEAFSCWFLLNWKVKGLSLNSY